MRVLLAIHNAYTDYTSGAAHSMRIIMQWLGEAGHDVRVLGTARFDARSPGSFAGHLAEREIAATRHPPAKAMARSIRRPAGCATQTSRLLFRRASRRIRPQPFFENRSSPVERQDVERIARAALKDLGVPGADVTVAEDAAHPGRWRIDLRGGHGPTQLTIRCGEGTSPQYVRDQVFEQFA